MKEVLERLKANHLTISSIESFTVGKFGSSIGEISGASQVYAGTIVSYFTRIKTDVVGVDQLIVDQYGVVSKECCYEMCKKGRALMNTDLCISFTGNAGPGVMENKKAGLVYIGINKLDDIQIYELQLEGNRNENIQAAIQFAKEKILKII